MATRHQAETSPVYSYKSAPLSRVQRTDFTCVTGPPLTPLGRDPELGAGANSFAATAASLGGLEQDARAKERQECARVPTRLRMPTYTRSLPASIHPFDAREETRQWIDRMVRGSSDESFSDPAAQQLASITNIQPPLLY